MKSKFAKIVDYSIGAILIFFAATAVMKYFTTWDLAVFSGFTVTACACLIVHVTGLRKGDKQKLSSAADDMFYEFMFLDERKPIKLLHAALVKKIPSATLHGKTLYASSVAAACYFDNPPNKKTLARLVACAKHYGAKRAVVFCKEAPAATITVDGFDIKFAVGNDVYVLFRSLDCLPAPYYSLKTKSRARIFTSALGNDKIVRYLLLSAFLFAVAVFTGYRIIPFVCASICAVMFFISAIYNLVKAKKHMRKETD